MKAVRVITGTGLPLRRADVDNDQIIPAEWLKRIERTGYEKGLFASWRDDRDFVLNDERFTGANVLVAGSAVFKGGKPESYRANIAAIRNAAALARGEAA